jgi:hypothetical protein
MKKVLDIYSAVGIGDLIHYRGLLDNLLPYYDVININLCLNLLNEYKPDNKNENIIFLDNIANLIFNNEKYNIVLNYTDNHIPTHVFQQQNNVDCNIPNLVNEFCNENNIIDGEYIVLTTKARSIDRQLFLSRKDTFCSVLNDISKKYKIVLLGERSVEMNKEYQHIGINNIFSIYEDIVDYLNKDNLVDLTIPALGITIPNIENLKKDCSIMKDAKKVITFGVGGNFSIALTVSSAISYFEGGSSVSISLSNIRNSTEIVTRQWYEFINALLKL